MELSDRRKKVIVDNLFDGFLELEKGGCEERRVYISRMYLLSKRLYVSWTKDRDVERLLRRYEGKFLERYKERI